MELAIYFIWRRGHAYTDSFGVHPYLSPQFRCQIKESFARFRHFTSGDMHTIVKKLVLVEHVTCAANIGPVTAPSPYYAAHFFTSLWFLPVTMFSLLHEHVYKAFLTRNTHGKVLKAGAVHREEKAGSAEKEDCFSRWNRRIRERVSGIIGKSWN